jgi:hypothetical protein
MTLWKSKEKTAWIRSAWNASFLVYADNVNLLAKM